MEWFTKFLTSADLVAAGLISLFVSATVNYWFRRREVRHAAEVEYEYEQKKELRALIGRHHGQLLSAAVSMNNRLWNLYENHDKGWLAVGGEYASSGYYFKSSVYRFMNISSLVRHLEMEAIQLDTRIAEEKDFSFLNYAAALHWVMTDVALFEGLPYDNFRQSDHFFSDYFRRTCEHCLQTGRFLSIEEFDVLLLKSDSLDVISSYFDGLTRNESRFRWDRLVAFHLLLMAFINAFGYKRQRSRQEQLDCAARQICNLRILENLVSWLPRHDLDQHREAKRIERAVAAARMAEQRRPETA